MKQIYRHTIAGFIGIAMLMNAAFTSCELPPQLGEWLPGTESATASETVPAPSDTGIPEDTSADTSSNTSEDRETMPAPSPDTTPETDAPVDPPIIDSDTGYAVGKNFHIRLRGVAPGDQPALYILRSMDEWNQFLVTPLSTDEDSTEEDIRDPNGCLTGISDINEAFFVSYALAVVQTGTASGSIRYQVEETQEDGMTVLALRTLSPENGAATKDLVYWAILVPIPKDTADSSIILRAEDKTYDPRSLCAPMPTLGILPRTRHM